MSTQEKTKFKSGEWAVLRNDGGGRLCQIHTVLPNGDVTEVNDIPSQQKYVTPWRANQIIKVASKENAVAMVAAFELADEIRRDEMATVRRDFERRVEKIIARHSDPGDVE